MTQKDANYVVVCRWMIEGHLKSARDTLLVDPRKCLISMRCALSEANRIRDLKLAGKCLVAIRKLHELHPNLKVDRLSESV